MIDSAGGEKKVNWGLRVMAASAVLFLLSIGLCAGSASLPRTWAEGPLLGAGVLCLIGSGIGMVVGLVMAVVSGLRR